MKKRIGIIGAGVVGTAVGVILREKGYLFAGIYDKQSASTETLGKRIGCKAFDSMQKLSESSDILFITTSDSAIQEIVAILADCRAFHSEQIVIHMSGAHSSEILNRAREMGAKILSVHPLQSFANPDQAIKILPGSVFSIEGDREAYEIAEDIVDSLGGEYFFIDGKAKPLYHAGACVVSNFMVTIIDFGVKLLEKAGIPQNEAVRALMPLITGSVNNIERIGIPDALTGPIARGDLNTVSHHLSSLEEMAPEFIELYKCLGLYTTELAIKKGTIDAKKREDFQKMLSL
jgi:predicted short-subunit dehydrogenase-like oxidoreductase (DUF2520 family)